jgi:predicted O-methyltransferase YrrM
VQCDEQGRLDRHESGYDARYGDWIEVATGAKSHDSVEREVGQFLTALVQMVRPRRVLETGTNKGYATCCIARGLAMLDALEGAGSSRAAREVVTIDAVRHDHLWTGTALEKHIHFVEGKSHEVTDQVTGQFDMLFLDSEHGYLTVVWELRAYEPRLRVGGLVVAHDALYYDGVGFALAQLRDSGRFDSLTFDTPRHTLDHPRPEAGEASPYRSPGLFIARKRADGPAITQNDALWSTPTAPGGDLRTTPVLRRTDHAPTT